MDHTIAVVDARVADEHSVANIQVAHCFFTSSGAIV